MNHALNLAKVLLVWLAASVGSAPHAQEAATRATDEYEAGHYAEALALFEARAAAGDTVAAELAGQMLLLGPTVYGSAVARDTRRAVGYLEQAARDGRPVARYLLDRMIPTAADGDGEEYVPGPAGC